MPSDEQLIMAIPLSTDCQIRCIHLGINSSKALMSAVYGNCIVLFIHRFDFHLQFSNCSLCQCYDVRDSPGT